MKMKWTIGIEKISKDITDSISILNRKKIRFIF